MWSFNCKALTGKTLVFWIRGRTLEVRLYSFKIPQCFLSSKVFLYHATALCKGPIVNKTKYWTLCKRHSSIEKSKILTLWGHVQRFYELPPFLSFKWHDNAPCLRAMRLAKSLGLIIPRGLCVSGHIFRAGIDREGLGRRPTGTRQQGEQRFSKPIKRFTTTSSQRKRFGMQHCETNHGLLSFIKTQQPQWDWLIWKTKQKRKDHRGSFPGGTPHMKGEGMLVVSLRGVNFGFWSHLGCSGQNAIIFSREGLV